jgi:hypothetical protein
MVSHRQKKSNKNPLVFEIKITKNWVKIVSAPLSEGILKRHFTLFSNNEIKHLMFLNCHKLSQLGTLLLPK